MAVSSDYDPCIHGPGIRNCGHPDCLGARHLVSDIPPEWEVYTDKAGNPVTITWEQVAAIWRAFGVWRAVHYKEKGEYPDLTNSANWKKSRLLGRLLVEGKPPLPKAPPLFLGGPGYHLVDPTLCPTCQGERSEPGRIVATSIREDDVPENVKKFNNNGAIRAEYRCIEDWHPRPKGLKLS